MKTRMKNELGHKYGPFVVIAYATKREPSNGCVKWECMCTNCNAISFRNGNNLRFSKHLNCPYCGNRR